VRIAANGYDKPSFNRPLAHGRQQGDLTYTAAIRTLGRTF
jgi:hypothetical protein